MLPVDWSQEVQRIPKEVLPQWGYLLPMSPRWIHAYTSFCLQERLLGLLRTNHCLPWLSAETSGPLFVDAPGASISDRLLSHGQKDQTAAVLHHKKPDDFQPYVRMTKGTAGCISCSSVSIAWLGPVLKKVQPQCLLFLAWHDKHGGLDLMINTKQILDNEAPSSISINSGFKLITRQDKRNNREK